MFKNRLLWGCILTFSFSVAAFGQAESVRVMTFNIRYPNPDDGVDYWPNRKDMVASMIRFHQADIIGVQEAFRFQLDELTALLPGFSWYGLCRTDGRISPEPDNEFSAIFYRKERFDLLDSGTFWLSESPDQPGSVGWDAALPRIASWVQFRDKANGRVFYHFNTHFDHLGTQARQESARLIRKQIQAIAGDGAVLLTGDFNCIPTDEPYRIITEQGSGLADALFQSQTPHHGPLSTWSGFQFPGVPGRRIDFIFVNDQIKVLRHGILSDCWSGSFPSDHLPVLAEVYFSGQ